MKIVKIMAIVLGVIIVILLGVLIFVKPVKSPGASPPTNGISGELIPLSMTSGDGHLEVDAFNLEAELVSSPLIITGSVTGGGWFFEGTFPIKVADGDGTVLGKTMAQAQGDWTSTGTVPFKALAVFSSPRFATGTVIFENDNPSGLPQNAKSMSMSVTFKRTADDNAIVHGSVVLAPTCPVESNPPNPQCSPKPYQATVIISEDIKNLTPLETVKTDASGTFNVSLAPGEYAFYVESSSTYPRCEEQFLRVRADGIMPVQITCDTGIR